MKHLHEQAHLKENKAVNLQNHLQRHVKNGDPVEREEDELARCSNSNATSRLSALGAFLPQPTHFLQLKF